MWKTCNILMLASVFVFNSPAMCADNDVSNITVNQSDGYLQVLRLKNGMSVVIEEGRLEPRSIGSISVKLYRDIDVGDFASAVTFVRDGTIINTALNDNFDGGSQISITTVTAGSGQYQAINNVCITGDVVTICQVAP